MSKHEDGLNKAIYSQKGYADKVNRLHIADKYNLTHNKMNFEKKPSNSNTYCKHLESFSRGSSKNAELDPKLTLNSVNYDNHFINSNYMRDKGSHRVVPELPVRKNTNYSGKKIETSEYSKRKGSDYDKPRTTPFLSTTKRF